MHICSGDISHFDRGDYDRVLALKEDVLRTMEQQFNLRFHTYALSIASRAYACLGRWDEAVEEAQKALSVAEEFSDNSLISFVAWNLSIAYTWRGESGSGSRIWGAGGSRKRQRLPTKRGRREVLDGLGADPERQ